MLHVFLSYVREDSKIVGKIRAFLENMDIKVWIDRSSILGGQQWRESIHEGINEAAFFIACFSENYARRESTYMDHELSMAIGIMRDKSKEDSWFIPLRLNKYRIPNKHSLPSHLEDTLSEIQYIDLFPDLSAGLIKLAEVVLPKLNPTGLAKGWFEPALEQHVNNKLAHYKNMGIKLSSNVTAKWKSLLDRRRLDYLLTEFGELYRRAIATQEHQLGQLLETSPTGMEILLSVVPHRNIAAFIESLSPATIRMGHNYLDFILEKREKFRFLQNWEHRDFVHIIYFDRPDESTLDMLYIEDKILRVSTVGQFVKDNNLDQQTDKKLAMPIAIMYPTSIISSLEAGALWDRINFDDVMYSKS